MKNMWEKQLMTGVAEIDVEHLTLIESIDELQEALKEGRGKEEVIGTLNFLQNYVAIHFKHEEALQAEYDYPLIQEHKKLHLEFIKEVANLALIVSDEQTTMNAMKVTHFCMEWLKKHIGVEDRKLAEHILACRQDK
jgi:hemerythrin